MQSIYCDSGLLKQLDAFRKEGGRPALVADHVDSIIRELTAACGRGPEHAGRVTRNGEARLKECVKYDLVYCYRLVALKRDDSLVLSFVGTHDACDRWMKTRRRIAPTRQIRDKLVNVSLSSCEPSPCMEEVVPETMPEGEDDPFGGIDEVDLRKIFHGLAHER